MRRLTRRQLRVRLSDQFFWEDRETRMCTRRIGSTGDNRGKSGFGWHEPSVKSILTESWGRHNAATRKVLYFPEVAVEQGTPQSQARAHGYGMLMRWWRIRRVRFWPAVGTPNWRFSPTPLRATTVRSALFPRVISCRDERRRPGSLL